MAPGADQVAVKWGWASRSDCRGFRGGRQPPGSGRFDQIIVDRLCVEGDLTGVFRGSYHEGIRGPKFTWLFSRQFNHQHDQYNVVNSTSFSAVYIVVIFFGTIQHIDMSIATRSGRVRVRARAFVYNLPAQLCNVVTFKRPPPKGSPQVVSDMFTFASRA